jgi:UDP-glucose 4-epimerase
MRILITGDKGFVGAETRRLLEAQKHEVIGFDLMDGFDIRDIDQLVKVVAMERPDRILHLAAIARFADADANPKLAHETNVLGTMNVAAVASRLHVPLVYASTGSVYMPIKQKPPITEDFAACGNSVYGCTKYLGELYVRQVTPHIILRYAHLYGHEKRMHGLIGGFLARIERGLAPTLYGGKQSNDFTYIKDVAKANVMALTRPGTSGTRPTTSARARSSPRRPPARSSARSSATPARSRCRSSARWTRTASSSTARRPTGCSGSRRTTTSSAACAT